MKKGDVFQVKLNEYHIADAVLIEIDGDNAILEVPATRIVMGIQSTLSDLPDDPNAKEKLIIGVQEPELDETRQAYVDAGIELDDDTSNETVGTAKPAESLREMSLDGIE